MSKRAWIGVSIATLIATTSALVAACGDGPSPAIAIASDGPAPVSFLFVQSTNTGTWEPSGEGLYTLTLTNPTPRVTVFADRPNREVTSLATAQFVERWASFGFTGDPPNAALVVNEAREDEDTIVVELTSAEMAGDGVRYTARVLEAQSGSFAKYESDGSVPASFGTASLFIDNAAGAMFQPIELRISNAEPGQEIALEVTDDGVDVAWSLGPVFGDDSGLEIAATSGTLPVSRASVSPSRISIETADPDGSSGLSFTVQSYLVASTGISTFYLRADVAPGVEVTASIGTQVPQLLDETQTLFSWNPS